MEDQIIIKRIENVERQLHLIAEAIKSKKDKKKLTLLELRKKLNEDIIDETDSTELIRKMRDRDYEW